jgi:two-component system, chemotaxis family, sensor kinase CheA
MSYAVLTRIPIRLKLILLAGVPVIGALILATIIARDAERQAQSAAALGSIEDLAHLSAKMGGLVHALQLERNELSLHKGQKTRASWVLRGRFVQTDAARKQLGDFLEAHKVSSLPPRLARDLKTADEKLDALQIERDTALYHDQPLDELLQYYEDTNLTLISATAALSQLADDGELMRAISALVIVLQIKEHASQEQALLSYVFAANEFPAGTYKELVTVTTEEAVYVDLLNVGATDSVNQQYKSIAHGPEFTRAAELRKVALDTLSDDFHVDPEEWSRAQGAKVEHLRGLQVALNEAVKLAAVAKIGAAARSARLSYSLAGGVIALSALLAGLIALGVSRSVASLARAAEQVSKQKNFGIRAVKTSEDELGRLTDTFNEMLSGIQARDEELRHHGENLELLVAQRTAALQVRNQAMRLVLDNVEQGLATIELDGTMSPERSRAFDDWFGRDDNQDSFADQLARGNALLRESLQVAWEQVIDGLLPLECAIEQMPQHIEVEGRQYNLSYRAIVEQESLRGVLLVVSDVTHEMERLRRDAEQRELLAVFESFVRDRAGFNEFFNECETLVDEVVMFAGGNPRLVMRSLHTLKGNCSIFGVASVAAVAHRLESSIVESCSAPSAEESAELTSAWQAFAGRLLRLSGDQVEPVLEVAHAELQELEALTRARAPYAKLSALLVRLKYERGFVRLRRVAEQAKSLAQRLGKGELDVRIEARPDVRFQAERWAPFWSSFVHVVRNALDHGIESPEARVAAGKPEHAQLKLIAATDAEFLTIEISDDGRGIDWASVRARATERGLPSTSEADLVDALFCDGLSTAESVTEVSGRGVGMSAVRSAARLLGGVVSVTSTRGVGTTVRFSFPIAEATKANEAPPDPGARRGLAQSFPPNAELGEISVA